MGERSRPPFLFLPIASFFDRRIISPVNKKKNQNREFRVYSVKPLVKSSHARSQKLRGILPRGGGRGR